MSTGSRWVVREPGGEAVGEIARALGLPEAIARLLVCRRIDTVEAARAFLHPSLEQLHHPGLMLGMMPAVERLRAALAAGEPVLIYGDYDVDGTVATVLLKTAIERAAVAMGVAADVRYHIPHRLLEGYGMQESRIEKAAAEGVRLVVSVDTGIRGFAAAVEAKRVGLDLIVTDHHLPDEVGGIPDALAVINPNQPGDLYPYKELCGAAVAFKLAQALLESTAKDDAERKKLREKTLPSFLKLLAVATIADAVPLTGENRTIASIGLVELRKPSAPGLRVLMELAQIATDKPISATDVGFRLAPRINAAGRMDIASDVVEMFLTRDAELARGYAEKLHKLNDDRRATEADALRVIEERLEVMVASAEGLATCLVLDDAALAGEFPAEDSAKVAAGWHRGVIGILASRVVDRTGRPALVLAHEEGQAYGSGRSVAGFHLLDALTAANALEAAPLFTRFGGHAHAVGFSLPSERVPELRRRMTAYAEEHGPEANAVDELECDGELRLGEISKDFLAALEQLGPFGNGNPEPLFVTKGVRLAQALKVVKEKHLRVSVEDPGDGARMGGMAWSRRTDWAAIARERGWSQGDRVDLAYRLHRNWHPDFGGWELEIVEIRDAMGT
ncbi:MAG: single-stranded-DNA-specific exonuclease RecJ [Acidobacteriota bacterium]